jgi:signal peptidase II
MTNTDKSIDAAASPFISGQYTRKRISIFSIYVVALIAFDQITKFWAFENLREGYITVTSFFNLVFVWNPGVSFGMFNDHKGVLGPYILAGIALLISLIMLFWLRQNHRPVQQWALVTVIAGAIGNAIDRFTHGAVIDFLDFHAMGYHWPAFNIADICVVMGIAILVIDSLIFEPKLPNSQEQ